MEKLEKLNGSELIFENLLSILKENAGGLSEFEFLKILRNKGFGFTNDNYLMDNLELFRVHFTFFHLLYKLREIILINKEGILEIHCLKIILLPFQSSTSTNLILKDNLADYYLDLDNLYSTDREKVDSMLSRFWTNLDNYQKKPTSYEVLGLKGDESKIEIKRQFRKLAQEHHPDKGGENKRFMEINKAFNILIKSF